MFNAKKSKFLAVVGSKRRSLFKATCNCVFYIGGDPIENVDSFQHLGHIITSGVGDEEDVLNRRNSFFGQVNNVLCFLVSWTGLLALNCLKLIVLVCMGVNYGR